MKPIYHITHLANLSRIVQAQRLWCDGERARLKFDCVEIAHQNIKGRRARTVVPVAARGFLADYVPFYFANRSPMLYAIHTGFVAGFKGGQRDIIYLVSSVERATQGDRPWCFTDGHAVEAVSGFFDRLDALDRVDWEVINSWSWRNTVEDPDRKRRKQAEFLVHRSFPWQWVEAIGVLDVDMLNKVSATLAEADHQPPVLCHPGWYYGKGPQ